MSMWKWSGGCRCRIYRRCTANTASGAAAAGPIVNASGLEVNVQSGSIAHAAFRVAMAFVAGPLAADLIGVN